MDRAFENGFMKKNWTNPVRESHAISKQKKIKVGNLYLYLIIFPTMAKDASKRDIPVKWFTSVEKVSRTVWRKANSNLSTNRCNFFHQFYDFVHTNLTEFLFFFVVNLLAWQSSAGFLRTESHAVRSMLKLLTNQFVFHNMCFVFN